MQQIKSGFNPFRKIEITWLLIAVFALIYFFSSVSFIFLSGWSICVSDVKSCPLKISAYHAHDAFWHMAIAETAFDSFPPSHPIYAGANLSHYNYLFDYLLYLLKALFAISPLRAYFQVFPILISITYICVVLIYVKCTYENRLERLLTAFILLLGNSYAFLMSLFSSGSLVTSSVRGFPLVLSLQPTLMFLNNQYALSLPILLSLILIWMKFRMKYFYKSLTIICLGIGILTLLKAYAGIALLLYIISSSFFECLSKSLSIKRLVIIITACGASFMTISLLYGGGKGVFVYDPFAFIRSLIDDPAHFFRLNIARSRTTLEASGNFSPRLVLLYGVYIGLFYLINFGARLGYLWHMIAMVRTKKINPHTAGLLMSTIVLSLIPLFFVQKGDWFNTMQFLYFAVFLSSLISINWIIHVHYRFVKVFAIVVLLITSGIPLIDQLKYANYHDYTILSSDFVEMSNTLRSQPPGTVSTFGAPAIDSRVTAFSGKKLMIGDVPVLRNTFIDYEVRMNEYKRYPYVSSATYIWVDKLTHPNWLTFLSTKSVISQNDLFALVSNKR